MNMTRATAQIKRKNTAFEEVEDDVTSQLAEATAEYEAANEDSEISDDLDLEDISNTEEGEETVLEEDNEDGEEIPSLSGLEESPTKPVEKFDKARTYVPLPDTSTEVEVFVESLILGQTFARECIINNDTIIWPNGIITSISKLLHEPDFQIFFVGETKYDIVIDSYTRPGEPISLREMQEFFGNKNVQPNDQLAFLKSMADPQNYFMRATYNISLGLRKVQKQEKVSVRKSSKQGKSPAKSPAKSNVISLLDLTKAFWVEQLYRLPHKSSNLEPLDELEEIEVEEETKKEIEIIGEEKVEFDNNIEIGKALDPIGIFFDEIEIPIGEKPAGRGKKIPTVTGVQKANELILEIKEISAKLVTNIERRQYHKNRIDRGEGNIVQERQSLQKTEHNIPIGSKKISTAIDFLYEKIIAEANQTPVFLNEDETEVVDEVVGINRVVYTFSDRGPKITQKIVAAIAQILRTFFNPEEETSFYEDEAT